MVRHGSLLPCAVASKVLNSSLLFSVVGIACSGTMIHAQPPSFVKL